MPLTNAEKQARHRTRKAQRLARLEEALREASRLLSIAENAAAKMRLIDKGDDLGLPHEVRMFALNFSNAEIPKTPEHTILTGNGAYRAWVNDRG